MDGATLEGVMTPEEAIAELRKREAKLEKLREKQRKLDAIAEDLQHGVNEARVALKNAAEREWNK